MAAEVDPCNSSFSQASLASSSGFVSWMQRCVQLNTKRCQIDTSHIDEEACGTRDALCKGRSNACSKQPAETADAQTRSNYFKSFEIDANLN